MMNSTTNDDDFGDNPFRSGGDNFFDAAPAPAPAAPQQSFQPQFSNPPPLQPQQQFPPTQQSFQPQPEVFAQPPAPGAFPPPSGPMDQMAPQVQAPAPQMQPVQRSWWGNCMACFTLDSYKPYFDIEADDIVMRMKSVIMDFYKPEHFRNNVLGQQKTGDGLKGPDLYGPFWITMTLIFFIGVSGYYQN